MEIINYEPLPQGYIFIQPRKEITEQPDIKTWLESEAFFRLMTFIQNLNQSVVNKKISDKFFVSETAQKIVDSLNSISAWVDEIPPLPTPQRFGNKAFRDWIARLEQNAKTIHEKILPPEWHKANIELVPYFVGSFGHGTRIDYGSGHELSFVAWLCCLNEIGIFGQMDHTALVLRVFVKYLEVVRGLQRVYLLEPAGSHGVWGLDDYQFLSYYWGSAQLRDQRRINPKSILSEDMVNTYAEEYMYFSSIKYINEVKKGPFHEHSPILYDISSVINWTKINSGLLKMYVDEALKKFPVVQHFVFGSFLPYRPAQNPHIIITPESTEATPTRITAKTREIF
ncbi:hypothetical protein G9A89_005229 [Geosiphon pyriformis]|nr:hypothetical protein G9A89_005229 [Geosiphon pyriformis]